MSCPSRMTRCTASPVRWASRSRWALATPMMSMRLTMPLESSNIFSVRRLAVPRFVLRHIPQRRQAGQQPVHRAFGQAGALRQAL